VSVDRYQDKYKEKNRVTLLFAIESARYCVPDPPISFPSMDNSLSVYGQIM